ncbi:MAG: AgmX/PglI C-terminal domain-containing protein [Bdellovibrionales bacterium]|nr:AgmX/PglI C-terminal domain-containing protein [Bdellovibrionales bacterium]
MSIRNQYLLFGALAITAACTSPNKNNANIDKEGIRATFVEHHNEIRNCYSERLQKSEKELQGTVSLDFDIIAGGAVENPAINAKKTTLKDQELQSCILSSLKNWNFPEPPNSKPLNVHYPLSFQAHPPANFQKRLDKFENFRDGNKKKATNSKTQPKTSSEKAKE